MKLLKIAVLLVVIASLLSAAVDQPRVLPKQSESGKAKNSVKAIPALSPKIVKLAIGEWSPFTSENLPSYGAASEIVTMVFKRAGYEPRFQFVPWKRAEDAVIGGEVFASFPYVQTPERLQKYNYSDMILNSAGRFFFMKKTFPQGLAYEKLEELQKYRLGGSIGYWYEENFRKAKLNVEYLPGDEQNIQKLYAGRIDLFECNELVGWEIIRKLYPNQKDLFGTSTKIEEDSRLHLLVSRKYAGSDTIRKEFNAALATAIADGSVAKILKKWGVK